MKYQKCMYWLYRSLGPVKRFQEAPNKSFVFYMEVPGVEAKDLFIRMTGNRHIDVNAYTTKKIQINDTTVIHIPCYFHSFVTAPRGASTLQDIQCTLHNGILIMTCKTI